MLLDSPISTVQDRSDARRESCATHQARPDSLLPVAPVFFLPEVSVIEDRLTIPAWLALVIGIALFSGWRVALAVYESEWQRALAWLLVGALCLLSVALGAAWGWL